MSYRRRNLVNGGLRPWNPVDNAKITAWHENTTLSGAISSVTDRKNTNPMAQSDADRQAVGATNGGMVFTNDSLVLPMHASNNFTTGLGFAAWTKQPVSADENWIVGVPNPGGTTDWKFYSQYASSRRFLLAFFTSGGNGRQFTTAVNAIPAAGTPFFLKWFYNSVPAGDANLTLTVNGVSALAGGAWANIGTGGTLGALNTVTGNYFIGNFANSDAGQAGLQGTFGQDIFTLNADFTAAEETQAMNFRPLT
jgi:hypothetical protein